MPGLTVRTAPSISASSPSASRSRLVCTRVAAAARSDATRRSAAASPTAPTTSCVPLRRSRSWPPPCWRGVSATRPSTASTPVPTGPPTLCALSDTMSAPAVTSARSSHGAACTASVKTAASGARSAHRVDRVGDGLDHPGLVVGGHDGDERRPRGEGTGERVGIEHAGGVDRQLTPLGAGALGRLGRLAHGGVLHRGVQHDRLPPGTQGGLHRAEHGEVGGLGPTGREDDVRGVAAEEGRHLVACLFEQTPRPLGRRVAAGRVAQRPEPRRVHLGHRSRHLGSQRCRGRMVEIARHGWHDRRASRCCAERSMP